MPALPVTPEASGVLPKGAGRSLGVTGWQRSPTRGRGGGTAEPTGGTGDTRSSQRRAEPPVAYRVMAKDATDCRPGAITVSN